MRLLGSFGAREIHDDLVAELAQVDRRARIGELTITRPAPSAPRRKSMPRMARGPDGAAAAEERATANRRRPTRQQRRRRARATEQSR